MSWTISHGARLVLVVAKGAVWAQDLIELLADLDRVGARAYRKLVDVREFSADYSEEQILGFAAVMLKRERDSPDAGPIAIVPGDGRVAEQVWLFADHASARRRIRVFAELHEARRWLDDQDR